jgi:uncharacterized phage infection (PIP) family protein YhgE
MDANEFEERFDSLTDTISSIADNQQTLAERVDSLNSGPDDSEGTDPEDADGPTVEERMDALDEKLSALLEQFESVSEDSDGSDGPDGSDEPEDADGPTVEERLAAIEEKVGDSTEDESDERAELLAELEDLRESVSTVDEKADAIDAKAQAVMDADGSSQQETNFSDEELLKALAEQAGGANEDSRSKAQFFGAEQLAE